MGTHCSSELRRGHISVKTTTMKLLLLTALAAVAMAEPEAEASYYGYNPGFYGYNHGFGHQQNWPSYRTYGFSSTCYGCRGKRSADADAEPAYYGYGSYGYNGYYGHQYGFGYRSYGPGIAGHPTGTSYTYRSVQGLRGKRSAEADAEPRYYGYPYGSFNNFYGSYGYPHGSYGYSSYGRGIAAHPTGSSFTYRSVQGFGK